MEEPSPAVWLPKEVILKETILQWRIPRLYDDPVYAVRTLWIIELGQDCKELAECVFIEFAECKNSKCACVTNYVENRNRSRCLLVADGVGSVCVEDAQCKKQLGGASECKDGQCACKEMYQLKNATNTCVREMLLGDTCKDHSDCHGPYPGLSRLECILGVCKCRAMYNELDGYCISSSQKFKASLSIIILALLLQL
ncbi:hypothetical protein NQ318_017439 [Aromia moschata]|uniref:EB domain-containing protein n=1 Tax=Aromia moschata TaxID=1265417 RepID=A0AAV8Z4K0_9CUCU|nr:hypothetical protein NQ318_017439 [Aromia moschata]